MIWIRQHPFRFAIVIAGAFLGLTIAALSEGLLAFPSASDEKIDTGSFTCASALEAAEDRRSDYAATGSEKAFDDTLRLQEIAAELCS